MGGGGNIRGVRRSDGESASQSISQRYSVEQKVQSRWQPDRDLRRGGAEREERGIVSGFCHVPCQFPFCPLPRRSRRGGARRVKRRVTWPVIPCCSRSHSAHTAAPHGNGSNWHQRRCFYEIKSFKVDPSGRKEGKKQIQIPLILSEGAIYHIC